MSTSYARRPVFGKPADTLVVEEPLEIRVNGQSIAVTMRTPGSELELALGFLYTEGIIRGPSEVASAKLCVDDPNVAEVVLRQHYAIESRNFYTTSSCGVCGKASIDSVKVHSHHDVSADPMTVRAATLSTLAGQAEAGPARLRPHRRLPRGRSLHRQRAISSWPARMWGGTTLSTRPSATCYSAAKFR